MMKQLYLLCLSVLACTASFSQRTITLVSTTGSWTKTTDWNPQVMPESGDIVVIPSDKSLTIGQNVTADNIHLRIYGTLALTGKSTIVSMQGTSDVVVYEGGKIQGSEANQQLRIGNNIVYLGSTPPVLGPATATAATPTFEPMILPVKFAGFSVARHNTNVLVQWSTAEEVNAAAFLVERSTDGNTWTSIATVAAQGNTATLTNYSYTDKNVTAPLTYYRIKQVDANSKYTYTTVKSVKAAAAATEVKVAAINSHVVLQFSNEVKGAVEVRLVSLGGQVVSREVINQPVGQVVLHNAPVKGNYIVAVSNAKEINVAKQVAL